MRRPQPQRYDPRREADLLEQADRLERQLAAVEALDTAQPMTRNCPAEPTMKMKLRPPLDYRQLKAARAVLGLGVHEVAALTHMGNSTIVKLEKPEGAATANTATVNALEAFYQARGVKFTENPTGRGVLWDEDRLKPPQPHELTRREWEAQR